MSKARHGLIAELLRITPVPVEGNVGLDGRVMIPLPIAVRPTAHALPQGRGRSQSLLRALLGLRRHLLTLIGIVLDSYPIALVGLFILMHGGRLESLEPVRAERCAIRHRAFDASGVSRATASSSTVTLVNDKPLPLPEITVDLTLSEALLPIDRESTVEGASTNRSIDSARQSAAVRAPHLDDPARLHAARSLEHRTGHAALQRSLRVLLQPPHGRTQAGAHRLSHLVPDSRTARPQRALAGPAHRPAPAGDRSDAPRRGARLSPGRPVPHHQLEGNRPHREISRSMSTIR